MKHISFIIIAVFLFTACNQKEQKDTDPLPSWNESPSKNAIIDFVEATTGSGSESFIPEKDRITVFDNDGTLWSEQPIYFQVAFAMDRVKEMSDDHPEWQTEQPFKALLEGDVKTALAGGEEALLEIIMSSHSGMTTKEFEQTVKDWINSAFHPKTGKLYKEMVYQPMLEVLNYLRENGFKTFIVSGGGIDFMRPWTEEVYGIPPDQVVGSSGKVKFEFINGQPVLLKLPEINFIDDKEGKPVGIHQFIGKKPIAAFGNSDGDLAMLQWTAAGEGKQLMVYIHHTDTEREWAYDRESHIGKLDKGLDEAHEKGWTVVDMKNDWKVIYP
jgi:hypothetical protein